MPYTRDMMLYTDECKPYTGNMMPYTDDMMLYTGNVMPYTGECIELRLFGFDLETCCAGFGVP